MAVRFCEGGPGRLRGVLCHILRICVSRSPGLHPPTDVARTLQPNRQMLSSCYIASEYIINVGQPS
jgi:hypothetical protein